MLSAAGDKKECKKKQAVMPAFCKMYVSRLANFLSFCGGGLLWFCFLLHRLHVHVSKNPSGVLVNDDFLFLANFRNFLRGDDDVTALGCSSHNANNSQPV